MTEETEKNKQETREMCANETFVCRKNTNRKRQSYVGKQIDYENQEVVYFLLSKRDRHFSESRK